MKSFKAANLANLIRLGQTQLTLALVLISVMTINPSRANAQNSPTYVTIQEDNANDPWQSPIELLAVAAKSMQRTIQSLLNWAPHYRSPAMPVEKYSRVKQFGTWVNDPNDDSCYNTRAKVLIRDSEKQPEFAEKNKCRVIKGEWVDPYTGTIEQESTTVQIDHMVPLKNAYMHGAWRWSYQARCLYANFMGNDIHLITVDAHENMSKGDDGPENYMPPRQEFRCEYLKRWLTIKMMWNLFLGADEAAAILSEIRNSNCSAQDFVVDKAWINQQRQIIMQNKDLCREPKPKALPVAPVTPNPPPPASKHRAKI